MINSAFTVVIKCIILLKKSPFILKGLFFYGVGVAVAVFVGGEVVDVGPNEVVLVAVAPVPPPIFTST